MKNEAVELGELIERLIRSTSFSEPGVNYSATELINPDGPEAASRLTSLAEENARQAEALERATKAVEFYAFPENWHGVYMVGRGPMTEDWKEDYDDPQYPDGKPGSMARETFRWLHEHGFIKDET